MIVFLLVIFRKVITFFVRYCSLMKAEESFLHLFEFVLFPMFLTCYTKLNSILIIFAFFAFRCMACIAYYPTLTVFALHNMIWSYALQFNQRFYSWKICEIKYWILFFYISIYIFKFKNYVLKPIETNIKNNIK